MNREEIGKKIELAANERDVIEEQHYSLMLNAPEPIPKKVMKYLDYLAARMDRETEIIDRLTKELNGETE